MSNESSRHPHNPPMSETSPHSLLIAHCSLLSSGHLAQIACLFEVTARKPGNIHRFADFADTLYVDFLLSASAIAGPLNLPRGAWMRSLCLGD